MIKKTLLILLSLITIPAYSSIVVTGTRFVYSSDEKEISVNIENTGNKVALSQVWLTNGFSEKRTDKQTTKADIDDAPFVILPPLFKLKPNNAQTVRILYTGEPLATDRETIFTLNVLDIPPKNKEIANSLQISVLSKFKLFYRPVQIASEYDSSIDNLEWKIIKQADGVYLVASNSSGFYITLNKAKVIINQTEYKTQSDFNMMTPFGGTTKTKINKLSSLPNQPVEIKFSYINDSGGSSDLTKTIN